MNCAIAHASQDFATTLDFRILSCIRGEWLHITAKLLGIAGQEMRYENANPKTRHI